MSLRDRLGLEVANLKEATAVIVEHHYLHRGRTMAQMPYWITLDGQRVGVMLFALPRMSVRYQGFGPMELIELARMWIDPTAQGERVIDSNGTEHSQSIASCAVGMALRRIRQDWHGKYPHMPDILACVSWADDSHHEGTIYRAANFTEVGKSGGALHGNTQRPNGGRDQLHADYLHTKTAFIFPFRRALSAAQKDDAHRAWAPIRPKRPRSRADGRQPALAGLAPDSPRGASRG